MTHEEIKQKEIVERYARNLLTGDEMRKFEEHYFACDECFEQAQMMERFIAGTRYAAEAGLLDAPTASRVEEKRASFWMRWMKPALAMAVTASVLLAALVFWLMLYGQPRLRDELARARLERERSELQLKESLEQTEEQLRVEREERAKLEAQLSQPPAPGPEQTSPGRATVEANLPLVMLEATRDAGTGNEISLPARAGSFALWVEPDPNAQFRSFRMEIFSAGGDLIQRIERVRRNQYGAIAVSLPAKAFQSGSYLVKLYGASNGQGSLVAEYRLQIRRR